MPLQNFNFEKNFLRPLLERETPKKSYSKPQDVLQDQYLTPIQKKFILETMLTELKEAEQEERASRFAKIRENINRAKSSLQ